MLLRKLYNSLSMTKHITLVLHFLILLLGNAFGQIDSANSSNAVPQASQEKRKNETTLSVSELIEQIRLNHPLVEAYRLESELGKAQLREKRGAFDPRFVLEQSEKDAGSINYYRRESMQLEIPTASPFQFETGYESGRGQYVSPELFTPQGGLSYAGVSIPLLKGLITDERRTTLAKAKLFRTQTVANQQMLLLDLSQLIWKDYIDWFIAYQQEQAYELGVNLSFERQLALRELFLMGGCNGMDTLENFIQLELFQTRAKEWKANAYKQRLQLSRHLWQYDVDADQWKNITIAETVTPTKAGLEFLDSLFYQTDINAISLSTLPDLISLDLDVQQKSLEWRLQRWNLLPKVDLKYQQLFTGVYNEYDLGMDRRLGLSVSAPLFLRKERGAYQVAKINYQQKLQSFRFKFTETDLKIRALKNQGIVYKDVYVQLQNIENGYLQLFELERAKFDSGDGTVFLLNTRENRYLNARVKTIEQQSKYIHTVIDYLRETGKIAQSIF